jgi:hypothetical protein
MQFSVLVFPGMQEALDSILRTTKKEKPGKIQEGYIEGVIT